jgi:hypothetical protein
MIEIWIVSRNGRPRRLRKLHDTSGGNIPATNLQMFRRPSAWNNSSGWTWASL